jgi:hypothetical protein
MDERRDRAAGRAAAPDFERLLFAEIEAGALDFPKGIVVPQRAPLGARLAAGARRLFLSPALAYGLLAGTVAAVAVRRPPPPLPAAPPPAASPAAVTNQEPARMGTAPILDLGGGPTRSRGAAPRVVLDAGHAFVIVSFLVPIRSGPAVAYRAEVADGAGRVVASEPRLHSSDALGHFVLVVPRALLSSGEYLLTVSAPGEQAHGFPFEVRRSEDPAPGR